MKLVLTDLDLTLLKNDKTISSYTVDILNRCRQSGMLVGFSTNRGPGSLKEYKELVKPDVIICNAGALIYHNDKLVHQCSFSLEETKILLGKTYEVCGDDIEITADTENELYWNRPYNLRSSDYMPDALFDDFRDFDKSALKFCVQTTNAEKAALIASSVDNVSCIPFSDIPWYKFSSSLATKENAVKYISEYLNISLDETVAFGDDFSDIGMLELCGNGVAMKNAIPAVKEIADDITFYDNDSDGVARYLENMLNSDN